MRAWSTHKRLAFTLIEMLVVIAIIGLLVSLLLPAVQKVRAAAAATQCRNNLRQLGLAMHAFHNTNNAFPPAFAKPSNWGWAVFILPYVEQKNVYDTLNPLGGTTLAVNAGTTLTLPIYTCPSDPGPALNAFFLGYAKSNYLVSEQICDGGSAYTMLQITDGLSNTLLIGERDMFYQVGGVWAGRDPAAGGVQTVIGRPNWPLNTKYAGGTACCSTDPACTRFAFSSLHAARAHFVFCDGSVHSLPSSIANDPSQEGCNKPAYANFTFQNLYFKDDGNVITGFDF